MTFYFSPTPSRSPRVGQRGAVWLQVGKSLCSVPTTMFILLNEEVRADTVTQGCKLQHTKLKVGIEISDGNGGGMAGNVLLKSCTISCKTRLSVMSSKAPQSLVAQCVLHFFPLLL